jgi:hypothetical protein
MLGTQAAAQEYPLLDRLAERVVQKYQTSSCQQLAQQRQQRPTGQRAEIEEPCHAARGPANAARIHQSRCRTDHQ